MFKTGRVNQPRPDYPMLSGPFLVEGPFFSAIAQKGCDQYCAGRPVPSFTIISYGAITADAATTSAFPTLELATVDADQTPNAVAAAMPTKTMTILRIVVSLRPVEAP